MKNIKLKKDYVVLLVLFLLVNTLCLFYRNGILSLPILIDVNVVVVTNLLLFLLALIGTYLHTKAVHDKNPNVFVRSVMLMTVIKFFILGAAAVGYVVLAKANRNIPAIIIGMILYIVYAVFEVRGAYKMNKSSHA